MLMYLMISKPAPESPTGARKMPHSLVALPLVPDNEDIRDQELDDAMGRVEEEEEEEEANSQCEFILGPSLMRLCEE